jgi:hypothetical protein
MKIVYFSIIGTVLYIYCTIIGLHKNRFEQVENRLMVIWVTLSFCLDSLANL